MMRTTRFGQACAKAERVREVNADAAKEPGRTAAGEHGLDLPVLAPVGRRDGARWSARLHLFRGRAAPYPVVQPGHPATR